MGRIRNAAKQAEKAGSEARQLISKGGVLVDNLLELLDKLEEDGLEVSLNIAGKDFPIMVKVKPSS